jgi:DnaA-homolog protein
VHRGPTSAAVSIWVERVRQIPLAIGPEPLATFETFVTGANAGAVAHLRALASQPGAPVYLWGESGCGKTHLLRALAHEVHERGGRVAWFDAERMLPYAADDAALIVLDGCEGYDAERQRAAFALFVQTQGAQIAAAGTLPPVDLPLREDLRTRVAWGHVFALEPLGEADARAALRREADRRGVFLSDEVMDYLLTRFSRDLKHLMALLDRLDAFALAEQRAITVPLLKKMFEASAL